jgi:hypothetical protein
MPVATVRCMAYPGAGVLDKWEGNSEILAINFGRSFVRKNMIPGLPENRQPVALIDLGEEKAIIRISSADGKTMIETDKRDA